jgi:hypothetical protein
MLHAGEKIPQGETGRAPDSAVHRSRHICACVSVDMRHSKGGFILILSQSLSR